MHHCLDPALQIYWPRENAELSYKSSIYENSATEHVFLFLDI